MQPPDATILRVVTAFNHAALGQSINQSRDRDWLDIHDLGQFLLRQARLPFDPPQNDPLGAGHVVAASAAISIHAQLASNIVEQEEDVGLVSARGR